MSATGMLREIAGVRQDEPDLRRRWFQDDYFDLFLWTDREGMLQSFQLAYERGCREEILAWDPVAHPLSPIRWGRRPG